MSNVKNNLAILIRENKNALANRDGQTPLFALAENIAQKIGNISSEEIEKSILELNLSEFDIEELSTLNSFIYYSQIKHDKIIGLFSEFLKSSLNGKNENDIVKRGLLLRFIIERDQNKFSSKKILDESALRTKAPWIWADCISYYNWNLAVSEISKIMSSGEDEFKNLLYRIPAFQKRVPKDVLIDALVKWYPNMNKQDREKLEKWATKLNTKISGLSISALRLIDGLPIRQKDLIPHDDE